LHDAGLPKRTWLHVSDTAAAIIKIIESGVQNEIYNISGNYEEQNIKIAMQIIDAFFPDNIDYANYLDLSITRPGQDVRYSINDTKLKALGWEPRAIFEIELIEMVKYYSENFIW
jgi:dTDP-D-glucose 4,6-dehydratase